MFSLRLRPFCLSRNLAPNLRNDVELSDEVSGILAFACADDVAVLREIDRPQLRLEVVVREHLVQRVRLNVVGIDRRRRHVRCEIDVRMPERRRHGQRVALVGVGAKQLVVDRGRAVGDTLTAHAQRRDPFDVRPVPQLAIDAPIGDRPANPLAVLVVVDEPVEDRADREARSPRFASCRMRR